MKRSLITLGAAISLAAGLGAVALANSGSFTDPKGDVKGQPLGDKANFDIVKGTFGDAKHNVVVHTVTVAGTVGDPANPGPDSVFPAMFFDVPGKVGNSYCDYRLQVDGPGTPFNHTDAAKANIYKCSDGPPKPPVGSGKVARKTPKTIEYRLNAKLLGKPDKYGFWIQTVSDSDHGFFAPDQAPNKGKIVHKL
jgi:hypothetical protein